MRSASDCWCVRPSEAVNSHTADGTPAISAESVAPTGVPIRASRVVTPDVSPVEPPYPVGAVVGRGTGFVTVATVAMLVLLNVVLPVPSMTARFQLAGGERELTVPTLPPVIVFVPAAHTAVAFAAGRAAMPVFALVIPVLAVTRAAPLLVA